MASPDADPAFVRFWTAYPKKRGKQDAYRAWETLHPDSPTAERIVQQVERAATTHDWRKDNGRFVPLPANYLSGRRFDDELAVTPPHRPQMVPL
jgi:hypothetical protein